MTTDATSTAVSEDGPGTNTGHGHVWRRPDRRVYRCGGPGLCATCAADARTWTREAVWTNTVTGEVRTL